MRLEEISTKLLEIKNSFLHQKDWKYAREAFEILNDLEEDYRNECGEYAGYSENLIRIMNSILMVDRVKAKTQFILGISSITDIISRELNSK